jgi:hypothetical protein
MINRNLEVMINGIMAKIHAISSGMVTVKTKFSESSKKDLLDYRILFLIKRLQSGCQYEFGSLNIPKEFIW